MDTVLVIERLRLVLLYVLVAIIGAVFVAMTFRMPNGETAPPETTVPVQALD
jgi:hypothetical protein